MKRGILIGAGGLILVVALILISALTVNWRHARRVPEQVAEEVFDGREAIATYEWFKKQEAFIEECLKNEELTKSQYDEYYAKLPEDMTEWTDFMSKEEASLRAAHNAHQKLTNKAIEDYNAKASMTHKEIFKDLPTNILRSAEDAFKLTVTY